MDFWGPSDAAPFMPQGDGESSPLMWVMVGADIGIGLACVAIAAVLGWVVHQRRDGPLPALVAALVGFVLLCAAAHFIDAAQLVLVPQPGHHWMEGLVKLVTAGVSVLAVLVLWPAVPHGLAGAGGPSRAKLITENQQLRLSLARLQAENERLKHAQGAGQAGVDVVENGPVKGVLGCGAPSAMDGPTGAARLQAAETTARELQRLAMAMSHDLRGPLRNIEMALELVTLELEAGVLEEAPALVPMAWRRTVDLRALTEDLLAYCRDAWSHHPTEAVDVHGLVARAARIGQTPSGPALHVDAVTMRVLVEAAPLETVVRNLVSNAVKHHHQPAQGSVWVRLSRGDGGGENIGDHVIIDVDDDGPGIEPAMHEAVFRLFRRGATAADGTGLGLALAQTVVERHGGTIDLQDRAGGGCWFRVCWPIGDAGPELRPR